MFPSHPSYHEGRGPLPVEAFTLSRTKEKVLRGNFLWLKAHLGYCSVIQP